MLEKVLEVDTAHGDQPALLWAISTYFSSEHKRLRAELIAVRALQRRLAAVKLTSVAFTARALTADNRINAVASQGGTPGGIVPMKSSTWLAILNWCESS